MKIRYPVGVLGLTLGTVVHAQEQRSVVDEADDAFGRRIGVEQIGLYSEAQVRGFNLQDAGNYRIDGSYFVRSASPTAIVQTGTVTRIGVNALRYDFPAPSGIVEYQLRRAPAGGVSASIEAGVRPFSGPFVEMIGNAASSDGELSAVGAINVTPAQRFADGAKGNYEAVGLVPRWRPNERIELTGLVSAFWRDFQPDSLFTTSGSFLPPRIERREYLGQSWTKASADARVTGLMLDLGLAEDWRSRVSVFRSQTQRPRSDFHLFNLRNADGTYDMDIVAVPEEHSRSWSGEVLAAREWSSGRWHQRIVTSVRLRHSIDTNAPAERFDGGIGSLHRETIRLATPDIAFDAARGRNRVRQATLGVGYRGALSDAAEARINVQKTVYEKTATTLGGETDSNTSEPWLYSGSLIVGLTSSLTAFGSYARGLEEAGVAPGNAVNRSEVLPAVMTTQRELGLRYKAGDGLSLIAGVFETRKPVTALNDDRVFGFAGQVRHRGVEASLTGRLTERLNMVAGVLLLDADLSGALVDAGATGRKAVGRPEGVGLLSLNWRIPGLEKLSLDTTVTREGSRHADRLNTFKSPAYTVVDIGFRYRFDRTDIPMTLRGRVTNLFNSFAWIAQPAELYFYTVPRAYALTLTAEF